MRATTTKMVPSHKGARGVPAKRPIDESTYSGRVAARMRALREEREWTVDQLTVAINKRLKPGSKVARPTVSCWDNRSRKIDPDYYPTIARVFGLTVAEFLPSK